MHLQAGYYCSVCECILRDSQSYLDHINGKYHNRALGMSMRVERSTANDVSCHLDCLFTDLRCPICLHVKIHNSPIEIWSSNIYTLLTCEICLENLQLPKLVPCAGQAKVRKAEGEEGGRRSSWLRGWWYALDSRLTYGMSWVVDERLLFTMACAKPLLILMRKQCETSADGKCWMSVQVLTEMSLSNKKGRSENEKRSGIGNGING